LIYLGSGVPASGLLIRRTAVLHGPGLRALYARRGNTMTDELQIGLSECAAVGEAERGQIDAVGQRAAPRLHVQLTRFAPYWNSCDANCSLEMFQSLAVLYGVVKNVVLTCGSLAVAATPQATPHFYFLTSARRDLSVHPIISTQPSMSTSHGDSKT
jgi:hypothetical protein